MANLDQIIADLVAGATQNGARVNLYRDSGTEQKLAENHGGLGSMVGNIAGTPIDMPGLGGMVGAAVGADPGMGLRAAAGSGVGGALGHMAGKGLGSLTGNPAVAQFLAEILGFGGGAVGGHFGGKNPGIQPQQPQPMEAPQGLQEAEDKGVKDACARFGVKQAFLSALAPAVGSLVAGPLARAGLGKVAPRLAAGLGTGFKGQLFDGAASLAGQALGGRVGGE